MNKPFAQCSLSDLAFEISLDSRLRDNSAPATDADSSELLLHGASAELLLPCIRNAELTEAILSRHPLVRGSEGLMCSAAAQSKQAWCSMLRDLCDAAGVAASDAARLRVFLVCKEAARRGFVRISEDTPSVSSNLQGMCALPSREATCSICMENYDLVVRCPRVLRCGHSLCQSCLNHLLRCSAATKTCPECRFEIKPNRIADFPKNFAVLQLIPVNPAESCDHTSRSSGSAADPQVPVGNRARLSRRQRKRQQRNRERDSARAWFAAHGASTWGHSQLFVCECPACAEWPHGIECYCELCQTQMEQRGVMCVVCNERYYDYGWPFGYCGRGCWSLHMGYVTEYIEELGL